MSQTFSTTKLAGNRVLVKGNDDGTARQTILDSSEFDAIAEQDKVLAAGEAFDAAVEEFFAPLVAAAEAAELEAIPDRDDAFYVVVQEAQVGERHQHEILHRLGNDTVVLRLIEQGKTDRLIWVGDSIEVLAKGSAVGGPVEATVPTAGFADEDTTASA